MPDTTPAPYVQATQYTVNCLPEDSIDGDVFALTVEYRGRGLWAVKRHARCLSRDGQWDYEMRPSEREDEWLAEHRFDLDTALRLAREAAQLVTVNGLSVLDAYRRNPPAHIGGNAEDCPGCRGTNPPYPFVCPASEESKEHSAT